MPLLLKALLLWAAQCAVGTTGLLATAAEGPVRRNSRLFASIEQHQQQQQQPSSASHDTMGPNPAEQQPPQVAEQALLRFTVDMINESEPLQGTEEEIIAAFCSATLRDSLITPNPAQVEEFALTPAWKNLWGDRCFLTSTTDDDDCSQSCSSSTTPETAKGVRFRTGAVDFPGLKVESRVVCGVHRMPKSEHWIGGGPYEFVVLEATNSPSGSRPMVWLFEKLTGASPPLSRSITLAGLTRATDTGNSNQLVLRYVSKAVVEFAFPKVLMRLLPMSKERTEEIGSRALEKAVRKEVRACMQVAQEYIQSTRS
jgi:hypothetical protein